MRRRQFWPFILTLLAGMLLTAAMVLLAHQSWKEQSRLRLESAVLKLAHELEQRLIAPQQAMRVIGSQLAEEPQMSRQQFFRIAQGAGFEDTLDGFFSIGFARQIEPAFWGDYLAGLHRNGALDLADLPRYDPPAPPPGQLVQLLEYLYPRNLHVLHLLGENLLADPSQSPVIDLAVRTGTLRSAVLPAADTRTEPVLAMFLPVFFNPDDLLQNAQTPPALAGTLVMHLRLHALLRLNAGELPAHTSWRIDAITQDAAPVWLAGSLHTVGNQDDAVSSWQLVNLPGLQWRITLMSSTGQLWQSDYLWLILALGCFFSLVSACLVHYLYHLREVAERKASVRLGDLLRREKRHRDLQQAVDHAREIIVLRQADGRISFANELARHHFGLDGTDRLKLSPLFSSAELSQLRMPLHFESTQASDDGEVRHYEVTLLPLHDERQRYSGQALFARDITLRQQLLEEIKASRDRLSELANLSSDWQWEQDVDGRITQVHGSFFARNELNPQVYVGRKRWDFCDSEQDAGIWQAHRAQLAAHQPFRDFEYTLRQPGREAIVVSISGNPIFANNGAFRGYRGIGRDVTALRQVRQALLAEQQRAQATLESIADGVITTDVAGRIQYLNPVAMALTGWELENARQQPLNDVYQTIDPEQRLPLAGLVNQVLEEPQSQGSNLRNSVLLNRFGMTFLIEENAVCIRDEQGHLLGAVLVFRDVSNWEKPEKLGSWTPAWQDEFEEKGADGRYSDEVIV